MAVLTSNFSYGFSTFMDVFSLKIRTAVFEVKKSRRRRCQYKCPWWNRKASFF